MPAFMCYILVYALKIGCFRCNRGLPFAFHHMPLKDLPDGFPIWFDINLSQDGASTWFNWVKEGLMLDEHTRGLQASIVTYNAELQVFGAVTINFDFGAGGTIKVSHLSWTQAKHTCAGQGFCPPCVHLWHLRLGMKPIWAAVLIW
jgi:hypothetical protein